MLGFWVTCGVKMMSLCHGWCWQPPQTAFHHLRHIHSVWAHWYAVHRHMVVVLHSCIPVLGSDFDVGVLGHLWSQNDVITSWFRLTAISNCCLHPYSTCTQCLSTSICCPLAYSCSLTQFTHSYRLRIWGSGSLVESNWCYYVIDEADSHLKLLPTSILDIYAPCLSALICCPLAYSYSLTQLHPPYLAQILGFWVTYGVKMMLLYHGWGWQTPLTASPIHIRHIHIVWAHVYTVHRHMVAALHSYTHPNWLRIWGSGSLVESKWCHYVMVDPDRHLKLLPSS